MVRVRTIVSSTIILVAASLAQAAASEEQCLAARARAASAYDVCQQRSMARLVVSSDWNAFQAAAARCRNVYANRWAFLQTRFPGTSCANSRFTDNGDGTVSDQLTGLMWEKKELAIYGKNCTEPQVNCTDPHDESNEYRFGIAASAAADGDVFTDFLAKLNTAPCFAGHCDWRLPTLEEMETILGAPSCVECIDPAFGTDNGIDPYGTGSVVSKGIGGVFDANTRAIWYVFTNNGNLGTSSGGDFAPYRAVRRE